MSQYEQRESIGWFTYDSILSKSTLNVIAVLTAQAILGIR